jgi:hypothetical protein
MVGSGIRKKTIPDPGSGGQKGPGSGSATRFLLTVYNVWGTVAGGNLTPIGYFFKYC